MPVTGSAALTDRRPGPLGVRRGRALPLAMLLLALILGGCESTGVTSVQGTVPQLEVATIDPVAQSLVAAAERTSHAIAVLSTVEQARTPVPDPGQISSVPPGLGNLITLDWVGPAEPLVARLASAAGYQFRTVGKRPSVPIIIDVSVVGEQVVHVLREVGYQMSNRAKVMVDADQSVIEVQYAH